MTRRSLMLGSLSAGTLADIAAAQEHARTAHAAGAAFRYLQAAEAAEVEAMAAQIIPSDGSPGAREAGCVHFIDRALESFDKDKREVYRSGLAAAQKKRKELFPESGSMASLEAGQAIALLQAIESTEFFRILRTHTVMGFFAEPQWGGNRDMVGWALIGLEHKMIFQPPFGYYDGGEDSKA